MEIDKFVSYVKSPSHTQKDLENILHNCLEKEALEHVKITKEQLDLRFPNWQKPSSRLGGNTPTIVVCKNKIHKFETATEAFIYIVKDIIQSNPGILEKLEESKPWIISGHSRNWFARTPQKLYYGSPHLAENTANYKKLSNGWFVDLNSNNEHKFNVLFGLTQALKAGVTDYIFAPRRY
jgi:hypothetical protein